jgi:type IV secretion system protein VirB9
MKVLLLSFFGALALGEPVLAARLVQAPQASPPVEFLFEARGVYPLLAAPGRITDIALEPGEALVSANPIAAGDTDRWVIGDTTSGEGETRRVHVLVKPTAGNLSTNLVIYTSRRAYFLELRASDRGFLTQVSWRYPSATRATLPAPPPTAVPAVRINAPPSPPPLYFGYRIKGPASLRPRQVWDDGTRTYIAFGPKAIATDLPPLFLTGPDGKVAELVNYHVADRTLVVDRLFDRAELRLGLGRSARRVRIERRPVVSEANP